MNANMFVLASGLSDNDLLDRIVALAGKERETSAELVAQLAALDARPSLHAAKGHGSLFSYCTRVVHLSEDAACNRIDAARACRRFPMILDGLASGALSLTTVRLLRPHLTPENHEAVLAEASGRSRQDVLELIARLAPRPDVPSSVRKLPAPAPAATSAMLVANPAAVTEPAPPALTPSPVLTPRPVSRPVIEPTSPVRYRVQFTVGKDTHDKLRRLQALLRREIRMAIPGPSSIARSRCSSRRSSGRRSAGRPSRGVSVPGRIRAVRGTRRTSPGASPGGETTGSAASWRRTGSAAASARSSSITTSRPTRWAARPRPRTSRYGAAVTTNTRRSGSLVLATAGVETGSEPDLAVGHDDAGRAGRRQADHPIVVAPHPPDGGPKNHAIV